MWLGFAVGLLIMAIGVSLENEETTGMFAIVGMLVFLASLIQAVIFYTCPHCGYSLMNVRGGVPEHCPKCGEELNKL